jgi:hypothetical protein
MAANLIFYTLQQHSLKKGCIFLWSILPHIISDIKVRSRNITRAPCYYSWVQKLVSRALGCPPMTQCMYTIFKIGHVAQNWNGRYTDCMLALAALIYLPFRNESRLAIARLCIDIVLQRDQRDFLYKIRFPCRNETSVNKQNWNETLQNGTFPSVNVAGGQ